MSLVEAESDLRQALAYVRTGDHGRAAPLVAHAMQLLHAHRTAKGQSNDPDALLDLRPDLDEESQLEQLLLLRAGTLSAEIGDYRGDERATADALRPFKRIASYVEELRHEPPATFVFPSDDLLPWQLLRQRLFCAWQLMVAAYRIRRGPHARQIIDAAIHIGETMQPDSDGLLAQLYYAKAKLSLGERKFLEATVFFRKALAKASVRFAKTEQKEIERSAAQYSVGKALALGLAQSLLVQGRMEEAHTVAVAGQMLLELTPDFVHRNYARQLLGSIQRASACDTDVQLLDSAAENLEDARLFFETAKKPSAAFRSRYELALIALHRGDVAAADGALRELLADAETAGLQKWIVSAHVGLSRVARRAKQYALAVAEAQTARAMAAEGNLKTLEIKAHTSLVQSLFEQHKETPEQLRDVEREVRELLSDVPEYDARSRVVALLVLVRVLGARGDLRRARATYEEYERIAHLVQSRRINDLAAVALQEISPVMDGFRCPADQVPPVFNLGVNLDETEKYVIAKVTARYADKNDRAKALGMGRSTYYKHDGEGPRPRRRRRPRA